MIDVKRYHHAEKRKVIAQALTDHSLELVDDVLLQHIETFCSLIVREGNGKSSSSSEEWSTPLDVQILTRHLGFDIMGDVCFGSTFDMMTDTANHYIHGAMKQGGQCLYAVSSSITTLPAK